MRVGSCDKERENRFSFVLYITSLSLSHSTPPPPHTHTLRRTNPRKIITTESFFLFFSLPKYSCIYFFTPRKPPPPGPSRTSLPPSPRSAPTGRRLSLASVSSREIFVRGLFRKLAPSPAAPGKTKRGATLPAHRPSNPTPVTKSPTPPPPTSAPRPKY